MSALLAFAKRGASVPGPLEWHQLPCVIRLQTRGRARWSHRSAWFPIWSAVLEVNSMPQLRLKLCSNLFHKKGGKHLGLRRLRIDFDHASRPNELKSGASLEKVEVVWA